MQPDMVADLQQQRHGKLRHRRRAVGGHVGNGDAALPCVRIVHDVIARCQHADEAQRRAGVQHGGGERRLVRQHDLGAADALDDLRLVRQARTVVDRQLTQRAQRVPAQIAGIFRISI